MRTFSRALGSILALLLALGGVFCAGLFLGQTRQEPAQPVTAAPMAPSDLSLPTEEEKRTVTESEVSAQLNKMAQLATYCGEYRVSQTEESTRYLLDSCPIPGTTNSITVQCSGMVKVGFDVAEIIPHVDNESRTITLTLPPARVLDNYILWDSLRFQETNSILNPITFDQYHAMLLELEEMGLEQVLSEGIYEAAEIRLRLVAENFLGNFSDYTVLFQKTA